MGVILIIKGATQTPSTSQTVTAPYISVDNATGRVSIICATSGATIRYTLDGSYPTEASQAYTGAFTVSGSGTIRARAFKSGYTPSDDCEYRYSISAQDPGQGGTETPQTVATPRITVDVNNGYVTLHCDTSGATIHYTLDGSTPTTSSAVYTQALTVTGSGTIKAIAVKSGMTASSVAQQAYNITPSSSRKTATPIITIDHTIGNVVIDCVTPGAKIYYTTDGTNPGTTPTASTTLFTTGFNVAEQGQTVTIKAIAVADGYSASDIATDTYIAAPIKIATPQIMYSEESHIISLSCSTALATIYYTTDGSTPTASSTRYTQPWTVQGSCTVKAIAVRYGYIDSDVASLDISMVSLPQVETPVITVNGSTVTITCATEGAAIHYTTDGSTPTEADPVYSAPLSTDGIGILNAIATLQGAPKSEMASAFVGKSAIPASEMSAATYLATTGAETHLAGWHASDYIAIPLGACKVTGTAHAYNFNSQLLNFYDASRQFVSGSNTFATQAGAASQYKWGEVSTDIPASAAYVRYCCLSDDSTSLPTIAEDYRIPKLYFEK